MLKKQKEKGITLIALVVTIIVLLILASISIAMLTGENSIINQAKNAKDITKIKGIEEIINLIKTGYMVEHDMKQPTARYIIEELISEDEIKEKDVKDYGDTTGTGIITVANEDIYIYGNIYDMDLVLRYEVVNKEGYSVIRLYPKIKGSNTYGDYAADILYGKTDEERAESFVEGNNCWNERQDWGEPTYNNIQELIDYWNENYGRSLTTYTSIGPNYGYNNTAEMSISWGYVKPQDYNWNQEQNYVGFNLICNEEVLAYDWDTYMPYYEYTVIDDGTYTFELQSGEKSVSVSIDVKIDYEDMFITDGNGTIIGLNEDTFYDYDGWCTYYTYIEKLEIPEKTGNETITAIGEDAFSSLYGLREVILPETIKSIGDYAFDHCWDLEKVNIQDGVTSIGNGAFYCCGSLTSITIPNGVTSIGNSAFASCSSLTEIEIPEGVTSIGDYAFNNCRSLTSITIPNSVTSIGNSAFYDCSSLTSITILNGGTSIGDEAFMFCKSLASITIPGGVTRVGEDTFYGCSSLTSITLSDDVTSIGYRAFQDCSSLTNITIPGSVTSIEGQGFYGCSSLTTVYYTGTEEEWNSISIGSWNTNLTNANIIYNYTGE